MISCLGICSLIPIFRVKSVHEYIISKYYRFIPIEETEIIQWFVPEYNYIDSVELFISNIYPETDGEIKLSIQNQNKKTIFSNIYDAAEISAGEFVEYEIGKKVEPGERYALLISFTGDITDSDMIPQLMVSERKKNLYETQEALVMGEISEYNVAITYHYEMIIPFFIELEKIG